MKKTLLIFIACLCCLGWKIDGMDSPSKIDGMTGFTKIDGMTVSSTTCQNRTSNSTNTNTQAMHRYNTQEVYGFIFDDAASSSICEVSVYFSTNTGNLALLDYYVEVWLISGTTLDTYIGRSDKVDGNDSWSSELVAFTFPTPAAYDCTGSNQYGIIIKAVDDGDPASTAGKDSSTNYANTRHSTSANTMSYNQAEATWNSSTGAINMNESGYMPYMSVKTMQ